MDIVFKKEDQEVRLEDFLSFLGKKANHGITRLNPHIYSALVGPKYIKIVLNMYGNTENRSVYCFLDQEGNIYKSASWKAPASYIRGSIFDPDYTWGKGLGPFGATYLR